MGRVSDAWRLTYTHSATAHLAPLPLQVRLLMLNLASRLIGYHRLLVPNFYPFLQRYLQPHQREITLLLTFLVQASHELVPPEALLSSTAIGAVLGDARGLLRGRRAPRAPDVRLALAARVVVHVLELEEPLRARGGGRRVGLLPVRGALAGHGRLERGDVPELLRARRLRRDAREPPALARRDAVRRRLELARVDRRPRAPRRRHALRALRLRGRGDERAPLGPRRRLRGVRGVRGRDLRRIGLVPT